MKTAGATDSFPASTIETIEPGAVSLVLATAVFAAAASTRCMDAILPEIARHYDTSIGTAGAAVTAYALSYSGCQLIWGPLADRIGPFRIVTWTALVSAGAAAACGLASTLGELVALRFLAGCVAAAIGPSVLLWVSHASALEDRSVAVARMTAASIIGTTGGQIGGGVLGGWLGWQTVFLATAGLFTAAGLAMAWAGARNPRMKTVGQRSLSGMGSRPPGLPALLRRAAVRRTLVGVGVEGLALYASFTYVAALLKDRLALGTTAIGALVALFGIGGIAFVMLAKQIVRQVSDTRRAAAGGWLAGGSLLALTVSTSIGAAGAALFVLGFGFFALHNVFQVRATRMAPDATGAALSLFAATFFLAQAVGATAGGWLIDRLGPSVPFGLSGLILAGLGLAVSIGGTGSGSLLDKDRPLD